MSSPNPSRPDSTSPNAGPADQHAHPSRAQSADGPTAGTRQEKDPGPSWRTLHLWQIQPIRDGILIATIVGLVMFGYRLSIVTVPMLLALTLAYLCEPLVRKLTATKMFTRPGVAVGLIFTAILGVFLPVSFGLGFAVVQGARFAQSVATNVDLTIRSINAPDDPTLRQQLMPRGTPTPWLKIRDYIEEQERRRKELDLRRVESDAASSADASKATPLTEAKGFFSRLLDGDAGDEPTPTQTNDPDQIPATTPPSVDGSKENPSTPPSDGLATVPDPSQETEASMLAAEQAAEGEQSLVSEVVSSAMAAPSEVYQFGLWSLNWVSQNAAAIGKQVLNVGGGAFDAAVKAFGSIFSLLFGLFLTAFFFYFFCTGYGEVLEFWEGLIPERKKGRVIDLVNQMDAVIAGFVRGRLLICALLILYYINAYWIIGVPAPFIVGLIVGLLTLIPYAGGVAVPVVMLLMWLGQSGSGTALTEQWWWILGAPVVVLIIQQLTDDYFLTPRIQGRSTNMDTPTILFASIAGGAIAGVYGLLLAIPVAACLKIVLREIFWPRVRKWLAGKVADPLPIENR